MNQPRVNPTALPTLPATPGIPSRIRPPPAGVRCAVQVEQRLEIRARGASILRAPQDRLPPRPAGPRSDRRPGPTLGLDNVAQMCAKRSGRRGRGPVADHFDTIARTAEASRRLGKTSATSKIRPKLTLLLYRPPPCPRAASPSDARGSKGSRSSWAWIWASIVSLRRDAVAPGNKSDDELFEIASPTPRPAPVPTTQSRSTGRAHRRHARRVDLRRGPHHRGRRIPDRHGLFGAFVSMPTKHLTILTPSTASSPCSHSAVMRIATGDVPRGPRPSPNVYWVREGHWMAIPYETNGDQIDVNPPEPLDRAAQQPRGGDENTPHEAGMTRTTSRSGSTSSGTGPRTLGVATDAALRIPSGFVFVRYASLPTRGGVSQRMGVLGFRVDRIETGLAFLPPVIGLVPGSWALANTIYRDRAPSAAVSIRVLPRPICCTETMSQRTLPRPFAILVEPIGTATRYRIKAAGRFPPVRSRATPLLSSTPTHSPRCRSACKSIRQN